MFQRARVCGWLAAWTCGSGTPHHVTQQPKPNPTISPTENQTTQAAYGYDQRVEVFGSKGMIQSDNLRPNQCTIATGESVHQDLPLNFFMDRYKEVGRCGWMCVCWGAGGGCVDW